MDNVLNVVNDLFAQMQRVGSGFATLFIADGYDLVAVLGLIMATWYTLNLALADGMPEYLASLLQLLIKCAVILFMLQAWTGTVHGYFVGNMETVAKRIRGAAVDPGELVRTLWGGAQVILSGPRDDAVQVCEQVPVYTPDGYATGATEEFCHSPSGEQDDTSMWTVLKHLPILLLTWLLKGLSIIAIFIMALAFMVVAQMSSFLLAIAFCLGPILIPWYILPAASFLFDGWLRFTIVAGLYKVVAWLMVTLISQGALPAIKTLLQRIATTSGSASAEYFEANYMAMLALAFVCSIGAFMMWQVPTIAQGLVSGNGGASVLGFGKGGIGRNLNPKRW